MLEFRPRPTFWRLAVVTACQVLLAAWIVNVAISALEMLVLRDAGLRAVIVYASPWDTVRERLEPDPADVELVRRYAEADRIHLHVAGWFAAGAVLLALIIMKLWPGGPSLAARMFGYVFGAVLATFGIARLASHEVRMDLPPAAILGSLSLVAGLVVAIVAMRRMIVLLGNVYSSRFWILVAIFPVCVALAFVSLRATVGAALLAGAALIATFLPIHEKFEQLTRVELREAVVPLLVTMALIGVTTMRALVVREGEIRIERWEEIRNGIPLDWPLSTAQYAPHLPAPRVPARC
ncbi:MAG: hypothetical protein QOJ98_1068 [Acidobacteriota bacterium]|jgi:hypothetical protein|nr:hypothetical protein [Acidobacteriota bacterium]